MANIPARRRAISTSAKYFQDPDFAKLGRYLNESKLDHLYTTINRINNEDEYRFETEMEGLVARRSDVFPGLVPLYSYFNEDENNHFLTTDWQAIGTNTPGRICIAGVTVVCEGIIGYVFPRTSKQEALGPPVYRYYNDRQKDHFYTHDEAEIGTSKDGQRGLGGYQADGLAWFMLVE